MVPDSCQLDSCSDFSVEGDTNQIYNKSLHSLQLGSAENVRSGQKHLGSRLNPWNKSGFVHAILLHHYASWYSDKGGKHGSKHDGL